MLRIVCHLNKAVLPAMTFPQVSLNSGGGDQVMVAGEELTLGVDLSSDEVVELPSSGSLGLQENEWALASDSITVICLASEEGSAGGAGTIIAQPLREACEETDVVPGRLAFLRMLQKLQTEVSSLENEKTILQKELSEKTEALAQRIRRADSEMCRLRAERRMLRAERLEQEATSEAQHIENRGLIWIALRLLKRLFCDYSIVEPETGAQPK